MNCICTRARSLLAPDVRLGSKAAMSADIPQMNPGSELHSCHLGSKQQAGARQVSRAAVIAATSVANSVGVRCGPCGDGRSTTVAGGGADIDRPEVGRLRLGPNGCDGTLRRGAGPGKVRWMQFSVCSGRVLSAETTTTYQLTRCSPPQSRATSEAPWGCRHRRHRCPHGPCNPVILEPVSASRERFRWER